MEGVDEEILARLPEAIAKLPAIFREVLELRLQANRSYGEIAERLGIPSRTVGTRILRARRQLRAILEQEIVDVAAKAEPTHAASGSAPYMAGNARTDRAEAPRRAAAASPSHVADQRAGV